MRTLSHLLLVAFAAAVPAAQAACDYPPPARVPDGKTASKDDMAAARKTVEAYMTDMQKYLDCLDAEEAALPAEQRTAEERGMHVKRHNSAVDAMEAVAAQFNGQVKAHKAASQ